MSRISVFVLISAAVVLSVFASSPERETGADTDLMARYRAYSEAVQAGNLEVAKRFVSASKLSELKSLEESKALAALRFISPLSDLRFKDESFEGDEATLLVIAKVFKNDAHASIRMVRENKEWKVLSEMWKLGSGDDVKEQPRTPAQEKAIEKLQEMGFPTPSDEDLVMSAVQGNLAAVKLFLDAGFSIESRVQGSTALIESSRYHEDVALFLIERGADVDAMSDTYRTALMYASEECNMTRVVKALLAKGARLDIESGIDGTTALQIAEAGNCPKNAELIRAAKR